MNIIKVITFAAILLFCLITLNNLDSKTVNARNRETFSNRSITIPTPPPVPTPPSSDLTPPQPPTPPTPPPKPGDTSPCTMPTDNMEVTTNTTLCEGEFYLPNGIIVHGNGVEIDCNNARLYGDKTGTAFRVEANNATVKNCRIDTYRTGISDGSSDDTGITINHNTLSNMSYAAVYFQKTTSATVTNNHISNSHIGVSLNHTSDSTITNNMIDSIGIYGISSYYGFNNVISGNEIKNSGLNPAGDWRSGIALHYVNTGNVVVGNRLYNNQIANIYLRGRLPDEVPIGNLIYGNLLTGTGVISYPNDRNTWCQKKTGSTEMIGNTYQDGATGPSCF